MLLPHNWTKLKRKRTAHVERDSGDESGEKIDICVIRDAIDKNLVLLASLPKPDTSNPLDWLISKISVLKMLAPN